MSRYLGDIKAEVKAMVQDQAGILGETDYNYAIVQAVGFYSKAVPYSKVKTETGDAETYEWELPNDYYEGFSSVKDVNFPANETGERSPAYLDIKQDYEIIRTATGTLKLRLLTDTPSADETVEYTYTTIHSVTENASTLPGDPAEQAVIQAAASICCKRLSAYYTQHISSTIAADSIDFGDKARLYRELSEDYKKQSGLQKIMNEPAGVQKIACITRDFDPPPTWNPGGDFMIHTRRRR